MSLSLSDIITLAPKIIPLAGRIEKAAATAERLIADPDVQDMIAVTKELAQIIEQSGIKS